MDSFEEGSQREIIEHRTSNIEHRVSQFISPSSIHGELKSPSSKSMMQRAVAAGLLTNGKTILVNPSYSEDSKASIEIIKKLGAVVVEEKNRIIIEGGLKKYSLDEKILLNCKESGLCLRMFSAISGLLNIRIMLNGEGSLHSRPISIIEQTLSEFGVNSRTQNGFIPIEIKGPYRGTTAHVDGSLGSQFLTGLLMALPLVKHDTKLFVSDLTSKPYVDMTLELLNDFGIDIKNENYKIYYIKGNQEYKQIEYSIEGDWSSAAFMLVAAAIAGSVRLSGLKVNSKQADIKILEVLKMTGAKINVNESSIEVGKIEKPLKPFKFDATHCPDLFPPLVALACNCDGKSIIFGVNRLIYKESDRAVSLKEEFNKIGADVVIQGDVMAVKGKKLKGGEASSHNDHRVAMALAVAGLTSQNGILINDSTCVNKSYPEFFEDLGRIARIQNSESRIQ
jgi:3-phosphoshikimate 1-carboxyvinyltransferase